MVSWTSLGPPDRLIILLHGVGSNAAAMAPLGQRISEGMPRAEVRALQAPQPSDFGPWGRQWFSVRGVTDENRADRLEAAMPVMRQAIERQIEEVQLDWSRTALAGFSQGAMMALRFATGPTPPLSVVAIAGRIAAPTPPKRGGVGSDILISHGTDDAVVPFSCAAEAASILRASGCRVTLQPIRNHGHSIRSEQIDATVEHLFGTQSGGGRCRISLDDVSKHYDEAADGAHRVGAARPITLELRS